MQLQHWEAELHTETEASPEDPENSGWNEEAEEAVEVQQQLKSQIMQRAEAVAAAAAEQLLLLPAQTRPEWREACAKKQDALQQQLRTELQPLSLQATASLQVLYSLLLL